MQSYTCGDSNVILFRLKTTNDGTVHWLTSQSVKVKSPHTTVDLH